MEFGPFPPLGWSVSRARDLHPNEGGCQRRYYWRGPGSWRGWEVDEAHPAWLAYRLKGLVTLRAVIGIRVHEVARELVLHAAHGRPLPDYRQILDRCWAELVALRSADRGKFLERPKKSPLLWESWYGYEDYLEIEYADAREHLDACLTSLYESDVLDEVGAVGAERLLLCDALDSVDLPLAEGDHVTVWAAPDVAYLTDDVVTIVDWKTGSTRGTELQLAAYALYIRQRFRIPFREGRFRGRVVALGPHGTDRTIILSRDDLVQAHARIRADVATMRSLLADEETAEPLPRWSFDMVAEGQESQCTRCPFTALCGAERPGHLTPQDPNIHAGNYAGTRPPHAARR